MIAVVKNEQLCSESPLGYVLSILKGKWKPHIIWYLSESETFMRYNELKRRIPFDISHKVFVQQLRELEQDGVIARHSLNMEDNNNMRCVEYSLTNMGRSLSSIVFLLADWGIVYGDFGNDTCLPVSRGHVGEDRVYYTSNMHPVVGESKRQGYGDVIVWIPAAATTVA